uniref:Late expression factor-4 n=1 Tax=Lymantria dispar multicapsid nuclear polyhedrosis virus TaxID=10449 RepID=A0A1B1MQW4_NPVLD|nr:late expression factor-4 [Lymantria dispar multiple nucleopolyhedrovirus]
MASSSSLRCSSSWRDSDQGVVTIEKEISYSINLSQDLLFIILESYISKNFVLCCEYFECVDEHDVRSRLMDNSFVSTIKQLESSRKFVFVHENGLLPLVDRTSSERSVRVDRNAGATARIRRILTCQVYRPCAASPVEIKFEKIYMDQNASYKFDFLMANKQISLLNLLHNKTKNENRQSFLGSDEILANLRLEYEYESVVDPAALRSMFEIVAAIETIASPHNIEPSLPYTTLQNAIVCRKFEEERLLNDPAADVLKWALKLDGVRGKGLFTKRNGAIVFMDDMRMFSGKLPWRFALNNAIAFQCELVEAVDGEFDGELYITDLLQVFKYTYNNRTQYECSPDAYPIDALSAVQTLNHLGASMAAHEPVVLVSDTPAASIHIKLKVRFQRFFEPPFSPCDGGGYNTMPTDGFVALDTQLRYVKYKKVRTVELEYNEANGGALCALNGPLLGYAVVRSHGCHVLEHGKIYETVVNVAEKTVQVLKERPDRILAQEVSDLVV